MSETPAATNETMSMVEPLDIGVPDEMDFYGMWDDLIGTIIQHEKGVPLEDIDPVQPRKMMAELDGVDTIVIFTPEYRTEGFGIVGSVAGQPESEKLVIKFDPDTRGISFEALVPQETAA